MATKFIWQAVEKSFENFAFLQIAHNVFFENINIQ